MQDRYVGDVGDFVKYGLLRAIRRTKRLGVAWYLHPNAGPAGDGRHTAYLQHPDKWRHLDAELFDALKELTGDRRSVANIQQSGFLGDAVFAADRLEVAEVKARDRERWRDQWFHRIKRQLVDCNLVFADPDNGFVPDGGFKPKDLDSAKRIPLAEALALAEGRTAVIYHHNSRRGLVLVLRGHRPLRSGHRRLAHGEEGRSLGGAGAGPPGRPGPLGRLRAGHRPGLGLRPSSSATTTAGSSSGTSI